MSVKINPMRKYVRPGGLPHFFCPGCGAAQVLQYFTRAVDDLGLDLGKMVTIGGVGCTARIPVYLHADTLHGVHGRTLAWAMGMKLANPELKVVVFAGDGDAVSIGGNHFIHAARRNLDVTMIVVNNLNFAMTGGQVLPQRQSTRSPPLLLTEAVNRPSISASLPRLPAPPMLRAGLPTSRFRQSNR